MVDPLRAVRRQAGGGTGGPPRDREDPRGLDSARRGRPCHHRAGGDAHREMDMRVVRVRARARHSKRADRSGAHLHSMSLGARARAGAASGKDAGGATSGRDAGDATSGRDAGAGERERHGVDAQLGTGRVLAGDPHSAAVAPLDRIGLGACILPPHGALARWGWGRPAGFGAGHPHDRSAADREEGRRATVDARIAEAAAGAGARSGGRAAASSSGGAETMPEGLRRCRCDCGVGSGSGGGGHTYI